jgi:hypothetical protein
MLQVVAFVEWMLVLGSPVIASSTLATPPRARLRGRMPWHADLVDNAAVDNEGADPLRHHGTHLDLAAQRREHCPSETRDAKLAGELR